MRLRASSESAWPIELFTKQWIDDAKPQNPKTKAKKKLSDNEQSERFKEAAHDLGVDSHGEAFSLIISKILKKNP